MTGQPDSLDTTRPSIAILGATGAVGAQVAAILDAKGHHVIAVSRHADQAAATAPTKSISVRGEFSDPASIGDIAPGIAVNCTGIEDLGAVQRWRDAGWAIIDITASSLYAEQLASATHSGPPLIVGVGLTPGLTSVLARHLVTIAPTTTAVTIACLVGLGEDYGNASRDWTYRELGRRVDDPEGSFRNFSDPYTIEFPGGFGRRPAWRFDFADRALLTQQLDIAVTTRYCFDSRFAGRALATASAIPRLPEVLRRINKLSRRTVGGTAWWAGIVETDTGHRATAIGHGQSHGTAAVTAIAADRLTRTQNTEARYLWDLIDTKELQADLAPLGVLVSIEQGPTAGASCPTSRGQSGLLKTSRATKRSRLRWNAKPQPTRSGQSRSRFPRYGRVRVPEGPRRRIRRRRRSFDRDVGRAGDLRQLR